MRLFNCCIILYVCGSTSAPIEYISYTPLSLHPVCLFCHITVTELFIVLAEIAQTHTPTNTKPPINRQKVFTCSLPCLSAPSIHPWNENEPDKSPSTSTYTYSHGGSSSCTLGDRRSCIDRRPSRSCRIHGFPTHNAPQGNIQTDRHSTGRPYEVSLQNSHPYDILAQYLQSVPREVETQSDSRWRQSLHLRWRDQ
jgi:hypothetical protein